MNEKETNIEVELIAKAYVSGGLILVMSSPTCEELSYQLTRHLRLRGTTLRPISLKDNKKLDDAGLKSLANILYKQIPVININCQDVEDEYTFANAVLGYSSNNENNLLIVFKTEEEQDKLITHSIEVANALNVGVLLLDKETDLEELTNKVEHYLFK